MRRCVHPERTFQGANGGHEHGRVRPQPRGAALEVHKLRTKQKNFIFLMNTRQRSLHRQRISRTGACFDGCRATRLLHAHVRAEAGLGDNEAG